MYQGTFKKQVMKTGKEGLRKDQERSNRTGIPIQTKRRFEEMSGYSFDDVRIHYFSDKPARFKALAFTQGNEVHIAPGQERYLEHELGHVVQQKEGRVRPTSYIGNMPVNDDAALEQEADTRWRHRQTPEQAVGRTTAPVQGVMQGQFVKVQFHRSVYEKRLLELWNKFREMDQTNSLASYRTGEELYNKLMIEDEEDDENGESYDKVIPKLRKILGEYQKTLASLDILLDMIKHYREETGEEPPQEEAQKYEHYHMYSSDTRLEEGKNVRDDADLLSAMDCLPNFSIKTGRFYLDNVFWIESFISFDSGAGMELLRNILWDKSTEGIKFVALGAYLGSESYYRDKLGMKRLKNIFVTEHDREFINKKEALELVPQSESSEEETSEEMTEEAPTAILSEKKAQNTQRINRGIQHGYFYPVYYVEKEKIRKKILEHTGK